MCIVKNKYYIGREDMYTYYTLIKSKDVKGQMVVRKTEMCYDEYILRLIVGL
jgi:hypothetical protein